MWRNSLIFIFHDDFVKCVHDLQFFICFNFRVFSLIFQFYFQSNIIIKYFTMFVFDIDSWFDIIWKASYFFKSKCISRYFIDWRSMNAVLFKMPFVREFVFWLICFFSRFCRWSLCWRRQRILYCHFSSKSSQASNVQSMHRIQFETFACIV